MTLYFDSEGAQSVAEVTLSTSWELKASNEQSTKTDEQLNLSAIFASQKSEVFYLFSSMSGCVLNSRIPRALGCLLVYCPAAVLQWHDEQFHAVSPAAWKALLTEAERQPTPIICNFDASEIEDDEESPDGNCDESSEYTDSAEEEDYANEGELHNDTDDDASSKFSLD